MSLGANHIFKPLKKFKKFFLFFPKKFFLNLPDVKIGFI